MTCTIDALKPDTGLSELVRRYFDGQIYGVDGPYRRFQTEEEKLGPRSEWTIKEPLESILGHRHLPEGITPQAARDIVAMIVKANRE